MKRTSPHKKSRLARTKARSTPSSRPPKSELLTLMNVGPATLRDLELLDIHHISTLAKQDPIKMYQKLEKITGYRHDPCVLDTLTAIVHEAKTGEKTPWWHWSAIRKGKA